MTNNQDIPPRIRITLYLKRLQRDFILQFFKLM